MEDIFPKNAFQEGGVGGGGTNFAGKIYMEIVQHGATNDQIIPRGKEFHKIHFPVMWTLNLKIFSDHGGIFTWR